MKNIAALPFLVLARGVLSDSTSAPPSSGTTTLTASSTTTSTPSSDLPSTSWTSMGCYDDDPSTRVLSNLVQLPNGNVMTIPGCQNACLQGKYRFAGVENGRECWCGAELERSFSAPNDTDCTTPCEGDKGAMCGGTSRINIFQAQVWAGSNSTVSTGVLSSTTSIVSSASGSISSTTSIVPSTTSMVHSSSTVESDSGNHATTTTIKSQASSGASKNRILFW